MARNVHPEIGAAVDISEFRRQIGSNIGARRRVVGHRFAGTGIDCAAEIGAPHAIDKAIRRRRPRQRRTVANMRCRPVKVVIEDIAFQRDHEIRLVGIDRRSLRIAARTRVDPENHRIVNHDFVDIRLNFHKDIGRTGNGRFARTDRSIDPDNTDLADTVVTETQVQRTVLFDIGSDAAVRNALL